MKLRIASLAFALAGALCAPAAFAAEKGPAPKVTAVPQASPGAVGGIQARRQVLFQHMLAKPDDLDAAFEYAALSARVGDLEAAISTLERMLIFAPGLPRLELELGVLYYRMGAYDTARGYFDSVVASPNVPEEVRVRVDKYRAGIDDATRTSRFSGQTRVGLRYQTNANRAPIDPSITIGGLPFRLNGDSLEDDDFNVFTASSLHYTRDLPTQGDTLEADLVTYSSRQFERDELDLSLAELTVGPAFDLGRFGIDNAALGVYGILSGVVLDDRFYQAAYGAGTRFVIKPKPALSMLAAAEYRYRDYQDGKTSPIASQRDGSELRVYGNFTYIMNPRLAFAGSAYVQRDWAQRDYLSYTEAGFAIGPRFAIQSPFGADKPAWTLGVSAGGLLRNFDDPDLLFSATDAEEDREAFVGATLTIPLKNRFALLTEIEYRNADSNYELRNYDNLSVSLSLAKSF